MTWIVYFVDSMPPEVCAAAMLSTAPGVTCIGESAKSAAERTTFVEKDSKEKVILIGTYWKTELCAAQLENGEASMIVFRDDGKKSPIEFARDIYSSNELCGSSNLSGIWLGPMSEMFHNRHKQINSLDESQDILNGLNNHDLLRDSPTLFHKFRDYFNGPMGYESLKTIGSTITKYQKSFAMDQVLKNSVVFQIKSGHKAIAVTVAQSVNVTHEALFKHCPDADLTIVAAFILKSNEVALSIRSRVSAVSAVQLIRSLPMESPQRGDGNDSAAGGWIPLTMKINELF